MRNLLSKVPLRHYETSNEFEDTSTPQKKSPELLDSPCKSNIKYKTQLNREMKKVTSLLREHESISTTT